MRIVFDLDDTICKTVNRDYENSIPYYNVISKIQLAKKYGAQIIIHTSRGMLSCGGDVAKAEQKNRKTIENWLEKHCVPYDELIFGKPYADAYIDDKAVNVLDFFNGGFEKLQGFSGNELYRIGSIVVKKMQNPEQIMEWKRAFESISSKVFHTPHIMTAGNGCLTTEYIDGDVLSKSFTKKDIDKIVSFFDECKCKIDGANNVDSYISFIEHRAEGCYGRYIELMKKLKNNGIFANFTNRTFCHGDFTLQNIIKKKDNTYWLIDPSVKEWYSWVLDAAKLRASINGLDYIIAENGKDYQYIVPYFDKKFSENELLEIRILEISHFIRVKFFARKLNKEYETNLMDKIIERLIDNLEKEI